MSNDKVGQQMTEGMESDTDKPPPKKRGRKPLTEEQKAERLAAKKQKAESQRVPPSLKVSFVCRDDDDVQTRASHPPAKDVMNPAEVISLLNSTQGGGESSAPIPSRIGDWARASASVNPTGGVTPGKASQIMEESDDDEEAQILSRPRPTVLEMSEQAIVTLMGAHTDQNSWPESTSICCWNCCHPFQGVPIPATSKIDSRRSGKLTKCHGVFCSFNCSKRYILDKSTHGAWEASSLLSLLYKKIVGHHAPIKTAPPRICLAMFGGNMSIEEYRTGFITLPATESMYDEQTRTKHVELLQDNCIPSFNRVLIQKTSGGIRSAVNPIDEIPKHERKKVLRSTVLHKSMNMSIS